MLLRTWMLLSALVGVVLLASPVSVTGKASPNPVLTDVDRDGKYRIFVIGDSNTADTAKSKRTSWVGWIQRDHLLHKIRVRLNAKREASEDIVWFNGAINGWACVSTFWGGNFGLVEIHQAALHQADAVIVSAGTNDLQMHHATPQAVVDCYRNMQAAAAKAHMAFFVATTPPVYPPYADAEAQNRASSELNALIRATFDPRIVIDFDSGFTADMFPPIGNGRHLNDDGEKLRARRVAKTLTAAQP